MLKIPFLLRDQGRVGRSLVAVFGAAFVFSPCAFSQSESPQGKVFLDYSRQALAVNPNLAYAPSMLLVCFDESAAAAAKLKARQAVSGVRVRGFTLVKGLELLGTSLDPKLAAAVLSRMPGVKYAEPDYILKADLTPNDPSFGTLWGLHNTGQSGGLADADIDAPEAWDTSTGDPNFVIAVIDTGVDYNHPDLAANMWTNPGETAGNGIDDDGNGYIDDIYGYDFANGDANPIDDNNHGTHCAGTIGGVGNNGVGVAGVNWRCKIMALKFLAASGSGSTSNAVSCLNYAVAMGVKVSNNSWGGGGYSASLYNAITAAKNAGHLFCAAAGNSNVNNDATPHYPSSYNQDNIISVASIDRYDNRSSFSNYGATSVDLGAPGSSITSTVRNGGYSSFSGTSMATPHVAGAVALVWSQNPGWTYSQARDAILNTVRLTSAMSGVTATGGVLNVKDALGGAPPPGNTAPTVDISAPANNSTFAAGQMVTFTGSANDTQDGGLSAGLTWTSSLNGTIGSGASFSTSGLSVGVHTITARVSDSGGLQGSDSISITIQNPNLPPSAPTNINAVKQGSGVCLVTWTDTSNNEASFQIHRQAKAGRTWGSDAYLTAVANSTSLLDAPGSGQFRYRLRARNAYGDSAWTAWKNVKL